VIDDYTGKPILTNRFGGLSGEGISGIGVECVSLMRKAVKDLPIIGGLGIESAKTARQYLSAGANALYVGTALRGMDTIKVNKFFKKLEIDIGNDWSNDAEEMVSKEWIMDYKPFKITDIKNKGKEIKIFEFDKRIEAEPGQFVFAWIPRNSEKPFSIAYDDPLTIAVRKVGDFTSRMFDLEIGDEVMMRGPYGKPFFYVGGSERAYLVGGGTGLAPINFLASRLKPTIFMGARTKDELLFEKELSERGEVIISTDDGSKGRKGFVTDILEEYLPENVKEDYWFYNCGPEKMMKSAIDIEEKYIIPPPEVSPERIYASVERYTPCGVGICGRCALNGSRTCVDGPVYDSFDLKRFKDFGKNKRDARGSLIPI
jgi:dihydroorotate dehydrogenase electron transfer subunit